MTGQALAGDVVVVEATVSDAADMVSVLRAGTGTTASQETVDSVAEALSEHGGLLAVADSRPVGALLFDTGGELLGLRRVAVHPSALGIGVAGALVAAAERHAAQWGYDGVRLLAGLEPPATVKFWADLGYTELDRNGTSLTLTKVLPVETTAETADQARDLGGKLATVLRAGDLVILSGDLGAGKTTFTQGLGAGLRVRGGITSPTFVISRVHPSTVGGPPLVHVDAYRLGGIAELDDLDLDTSLDEAVTVVEWGEGVAESLADTRLEVSITRARGGDLTDDVDPRRLRFTPLGRRWIGSGLRRALA
jgi:tRNA threonylcarbamoyladenosine biosynthesis protein TsaE